MQNPRRTFLKQLSFGAAGVGLSCSFPPRLLAMETSKVGYLPRSTPEAQGVSSSGVLEFLAGWADLQKTVYSQPHSVMLLRHGHVVAEGWWAPYRADANHILHSVGKSFTSMAIGFLIAEGRLTVEDHIVQLFPNELAASVSSNLAALRVKHLLTMSAGHSQDSDAVFSKEEDWVHTFLSLPFEHSPGSVFRYDNIGVYMLSAIVQKRSGEKLMDYLTRRLFVPMGAYGMTWESSSEGINIGAFGLSATTETVAKLGQFCLQEGSWDGRHLLPPAWMREATTFKIQQPVAYGGVGPDWAQGYDYLFWRCRHNAYRADGAYGQFSLVLPEQDAVIAITGETGDPQPVLDLVWKHLLPALHAAPLPKDVSAEGRLQEQLASLTLPLPSGAPSSSKSASLENKIFHLEPNALQAQSVSLSFRGGGCRFTLDYAGGRSEVRCGAGHWIDGLVTMPAIPPALNMFGATSPKGPVKVAAAGAWRDSNTLEMHWHYYELGHYDTVTCRFDNGRVSVKFLTSVDQMNPNSETRPVLSGQSVL